MKSEIQPMSCNRRNFVKTSLFFSCWLFHQRNFVLAAAVESEEQLVNDLLKKLEQAKIPQNTVLKGERFIAIGSARPDYMKKVIHLADETYAAYSRYLSGLRLPVSPGENRLIVAVLANSGQYSRFIDQTKARNEGGHYDIDANWTVTFDHRGRSKSTRSDLERSNLVTLIHEMTHQLSYNTGLLDPGSDIPMIVSEGLATLSEPSRSAIIPGFGEINQPRLAVMSLLRKRNPKAWIPLTKLIETDDAFFAEEENVLQMAYSQAWLFWDTLIGVNAFRPKIKGYLTRINSRKKPDSRITDLVDEFGSIARVEGMMLERLKELSQ